VGGATRNTLDGVQERAGTVERGGLDRREEAVRLAKLRGQRQRAIRASPLETLRRDIR